MDDARVEIRDLVLRLPGLELDRHDAGLLGEEVVRCLGDELAGWRFTHAPAALDLRITLPANTRRDELARLIARQIARALQ